MTKKTWKSPELKRMVAGAAEARTNNGIRDGGNVGGNRS